MLWGSFSLNKRKLFSLDRIRILLSRIWHQESRAHPAWGFMEGLNCSCHASSLPHPQGELLGLTHINNQPNSHTQMWSQANTMEAILQLGLTLPR